MESLHYLQKKRDMWALTHLIGTLQGLPVLISLRTILQETCFHTRTGLWWAWLLHLGITVHYSIQPLGTEESGMGEPWWSKQCILRESSVFREQQWWELRFSHTCSCSATMCLVGAFQSAWVSFHLCFSTWAILWFPTPPGSWQTPIASPHLGK